MTQEPRLTIPVDAGEIVVRVAAGRSVKLTNLRKPFWDDPPHHEG